MHITQRQFVSLEIADVPQHGKADPDNLPSLGFGSGSFVEKPRQIFKEALDFQRSPRIT